MVTYSSGNHGQAVAIAAESLGIPATIVMPADAPALKLAATRAHGARIVTYDRAAEDREAIAQRIARETGATIVPPYDHAWTITGQGTAALELLEEAPDLDALVIPIGGGGLISGSSIAAHAIRAGIRVFGVEPEQGNDTLLSLRAGSRVEIPLPDTIADGLRATKPGALTFPIVQKHVEDIVLVSDSEIRSRDEISAHANEDPGGTERRCFRRGGDAPQNPERCSARRGNSLGGKRRPGMSSGLGGLVARFFQEATIERPVHQLVGQLERQLLEVNQIDGVRQHITRMTAAKGSLCLPIVLVDEPRD